MSVNIRDYVSDDHVESIGEIARSQSAIIQALSIDNSNLKSQLQQKENIIKEVREHIDNLKPLTIVETSIKEELKSAYNPKETSIKGTDEYFNTVCHLEDFEIAIWNIKEILDKGE